MDRNVLQHFLCGQCHSYTAVTRSPEPRNLGQVAPRAGEEVASVRKYSECTSLALATHSFVWKRNFDIKKIENDCHQSK